VRRNSLSVGLALWCVVAVALQAQDAKPTLSEELGRGVYVEKACWQCHSQDGGARVLERLIGMIKTMRDRLQKIDIIYWESE
jgi:hypothetical protein